MNDLSINLTIWLPSDMDISSCMHSWEDSASFIYIFLKATKITISDKMASAVALYKGGKIIKETIIIAGGGEGLPVDKDIQRWQWTGLVLGIVGPS